MIPCRKSKLTYLFKSYFEGNGAIKMVLCLNPGQREFNETSDVLKFGELSQEILIAKRAHAQMPLFSNSNIFTSLYFGPSYPKRFLENPEDDQIIPEWIEISEKRQEAMRKNWAQFQQFTSQFRRTLQQKESDSAQAKMEAANVKKDLEARDLQVKEYENIILHLRRELDTVIDEKNQVKEEKSNFYNELRKKEILCIEYQKELNDMRASMTNCLKQERELLKTWCKQKLNKYEEELKRMKLINQDKLNLVKKILIDDGEVDDLFSEIKLMSPTKRELNPSGSSGQTLQQTQTNIVSGTGYQSQKKQQPHEPSSVIHAPPVVNPRYAAGPNAPNEKWIEHVPPGSVELGTVLKPVFKNAKSVTNLKPSDFIKNKNITKYALTHNRATDSGNIETEVFKGDVIPSSTGGAQVIFNDVETLKQDSPMIPGLVSSRKRAIEQNFEQQTGTSNCGTPSSTATARSEEDNGSSLYNTPITTPCTSANSAANRNK